MDLSYTDKLIQSRVDAGELHGGHLRVIRSGKVEHEKLFGARDLQSGAPMAGNGLYRIYSASKPITATAAMILWERGALDLFEPVSKYLKGFKDQKVYQNGKLVPVEREVTLYDLLNMTSGLVYPDQDDAGQAMAKVFDEGIERALRGEGWSTTEFMDRVGQCPLAFQPGALWRYGTSADVMGAVIEVASGMKFGEFLRREIFTPLGMADTDFYVPAEKRDRIVTMMQNDIVDGKPALTPYLGHNLCILDGQSYPAFESGGAGLFSTVDDYERFCRMLLGGGTLDGKRILGQKTVEFMRLDQLTPAQAVTYNWEQLLGYGYGCFMRSLQSRQGARCNGSLGEFGWDGWAGAYAAICPGDDAIVLFFMQQVNWDGLMSFRRRMLASIYARF